MYGIRFPIACYFNRKPNIGIPIVCHQRLYIKCRTGDVLLCIYKIRMHAAWNSWDNCNLNNHDFRPWKALNLLVLRSIFPGKARNCTLILKNHWVSYFSASLIFVSCCGCCMVLWYLCTWWRTFIYVDTFLWSLRSVFYVMVYIGPELDINIEPGVLCCSGFPNPVCCDLVALSVR